MGRPAKALSGVEPVRGFKSHPLRQLTVAVVVGASALGVVATPVSAGSCERVHRAKPNDSWTRLAARFDVPLRTLYSLNSAKESTPIYVGDRICLPPEPDAPAVARAESTTYTRREIVQIIRDVWPDDQEENALFVAQRESKLRPGAVGGTGKCCYGLFQIYYRVHKGWLAGIGVTEAAQLLDPRVSAEAALELYRRNGSSWRPWWTKSWRP
jgi:hypothetical protein